MGISAGLIRGRASAQRALPRFCVWHGVIRRHARPHSILPLPRGSTAAGGHAGPGHFLCRGAQPGGRAGRGHRLQLRYCTRRLGACAGRGTWRFRACLGKCGAFHGAEMARRGLFGLARRSHHHRCAARCGTGCGWRTGPDGPPKPPSPRRKEVLVSEQSNASVAASRTSRVV